MKKLTRLYLLRYDHADLESVKTWHAVKKSIPAVTRSSKSASLKQATENTETFVK